MADPLDNVFAALADPTRRDIVARLASADATVGELAEPYDMSVQAISKHLQVLERAGLVSKTRDAQRRSVHLEAEVFDLMTKWIERYRREAEARYRRLDAVLAAMNPTTTDPIRRGARIMSTDDHRNHDHGRRQGADHPHRPATSPRHRRSCCGPTPTPSCSCAGSGPNGMYHHASSPGTPASGGEWRYVVVAGGEEFGFRGCFHTIDDDRLVQTFTFEGMPDRSPSRRCGSRTSATARTRLHARSLCDSFEARDGWLASGMEVGIEDGYAKLAAARGRRPCLTPPPGTAPTPPGSARS